MPGPIINLAGMRYGKVEVLSLVGRADAPTKRTWWLCRCDCGKEFKRQSHHLRYRGTNQSCGCVKLDRPVKYAVLVDGEHLTISQASERFGMPRHVVRRAAELGKLTHEWLVAWKQRADRLIKAKELGLTNHVLYRRRLKYGDVDKIYTMPLNQGIRRDLQKQREVG